MNQSAYLECYALAYEAMQDIDMIPDYSAATEGLHGDIHKLEKKYNPIISECSAKFSAAYNAKNWKEAHTAITGIENAVKEWKNDLKNLPPETKVSKVGRVSFKLAIAVAGIALIVAAPTITTKIIGQFTKIGGTALGKSIAKVFNGVMKKVPAGVKSTVHKLQNPTLSAGAGIKAAAGNIVKSSVANMTTPSTMAKTVVTGKVAGSGFKLLGKAVGTALTPKSEAAAIQYGDDANGKDKLYLNAHASLDFWLQTCKDLHVEVNAASKVKPATEGVIPKFVANQLNNLDWDVFDHSCEFFEAIEEKDYAKADACLTKCEAQIYAARATLKGLPPAPIGDRIVDSLRTVGSRIMTAYITLWYNAAPFTGIDFGVPLDRMDGVVKNLRRILFNGSMNVLSSLSSLCVVEGGAATFRPRKANVTVLVKTVYHNTPNLQYPAFADMAILVEQCAYELSEMKGALKVLKSKK